MGQGSGIGLQNGAVGWDYEMGLQDGAAGGSHCSGTCNVWDRREGGTLLELVWALAGAGGQSRAVNQPLWLSGRIGEALNGSTGQFLLPNPWCFVHALRFVHRIGKRSWSGELPDGDSVQQSRYQNQPH